MRAKAVREVCRELGALLFGFDLLLDSESPARQGAGCIPRHICQRVEHIHDAEQRAVHAFELVRRDAESPAATFLAAEQSGFARPIGLKSTVEAIFSKVACEFRGTQFLRTSTEKTGKHPDDWRNEIQGAVPFNAKNLFAGTEHAAKRSGGKR